MMDTATLRRKSRSRPKTKRINHQRSKYKDSKMKGFKVRKECINIQLSHSDVYYQDNDAILCILDNNTSHSNSSMNYGVLPFYNK